jgi:type II secretory ATPase GspE/PulE/Tfp pilus assembly ATPase PilB-like protein
VVVPAETVTPAAKFYPNTYQEQPTLVVPSPQDLTHDEALDAEVQAFNQPQRPPVSRSQLQDPQAPQPLALMLENAEPVVMDSTADFSALLDLAPKALTQELLRRVLAEGIGRLYLERQSQQGRILWSRDGVLQSVLESVPINLFQSVVNELKLMMHLSLIPVRKSKQIELERTYQDQRVLLRFRLMPGNHGEEATLQVLRGAALKFYQQQQIEKMGRDALGMAHTLQQRLNEIRTQSRQALDFELTQTETLPAIVAMLKSMEAQVEELMKASEAD